MIPINYGKSQEQQIFEAWTVLGNKMIPPIGALQWSNFVCAECVRPSVFCIENALYCYDVSEVVS